ncbi:MAG: hypothetical protein M5T61_03475 [Acidimicrobiia bacterium]|nr:hypothetical protein [Acidimicrobiia bacterium]
MTLSEASGAPVSVRYDATDGSAESPGDYTATGGTLTFAAGETEASIEVEINGDTAVEADETVRVTLSDAAYAAVGGATGIVTILDDDGVVADDDVTILDDDQMVGAESAAPDSGTRSGGTLPYTGGGSQAPLGLGLVVAGAFAVAVGGLRRRRHVGAA